MYPKFYKENNQEPITFRIILSASFGIELNYLDGYLLFREVKNQAEVDSWESEFKWEMSVECDKSEIIEAFNKCETYLGDKRAKIEKLFNGGLELYQ